MEAIFAHLWHELCILQVILLVCTETLRFVIGAFYVFRFAVLHVWILFISRFMIGREKPGEQSEVAQLIQQTLEQERWQREMMEQRYKQYMDDDEEVRVVKPGKKVTTKSYRFLSTAATLASARCTPLLVGIAQQAAA